MTLIGEYQCFCDWPIQIQIGDTSVCIEYLVNCNALWAHMTIFQRLPTVLAQHHWQAICLPLVLCKETVKESITAIGAVQGDCELVYYNKLVSGLSFLAS